MSSQSRINASILCFPKFGPRSYCARNPGFAALHHYLQRQAEWEALVGRCSEARGCSCGKYFAVMAGGHNDGIHFWQGLIRAT